MVQELKSHAHCVFRLTYHLVLVTKYRRKVLTPEMRKRLREIFDYLCIRWGCELIEFGGEEDHVHLVFEGHPNLKLSAFVNNLKTVSSRRLRKEFAGHLAKYYWKSVLWHRSYCIVTTGGAPLEVLKRYVQSQEVGEIGGLTPLNLSV